jgi:oxygen-dependent protoporphyrinogen oxidase
MSAPRSPILVVGAGIGGLTVALDLARAGLRPLVLDAAEVAGGVLSAHTVGGLTLDAGAESFAVGRPATAALIDELGLADRVVTPSPVGAWVRHGGGTAPLPASAFLGIPGHPWASDVRRIIGPSGAARTLLDRVRPVRQTVASAGSLGALVRSRMGRRVLDRLVEPVAGGVYAADPDTLDIAVVAPGLPDALREHGSLAAAARAVRGGGGRPGSAVASVAGGLHTLVPVLVAAVTAAGGTVRTGVRVNALIRADGWRADTGAGEVRADRVVLALPASAAARVLTAAMPPSTPLTTALTGVAADVFAPPVSPVALVTLVVDDARLDAAPRGTGILVAAKARGPRAKALTHATAKWSWLAESAGPGRHVLRLSYGRGPADRLPGDADLPAIALTDASDLLGVPLTPGSVVDADVVHWDSALPVPRPGHAAAVAALRTAAQPLGLSIAGSTVAGTGLGAVIGDARDQARRLVDVARATPAAG